MRLRLTPDDLLSTTRAVRRRLDLTRPVERSVLEECLALAQQAPTGGNQQLWRFVVVTEPALRRGLAELWRAQADLYLQTQLPADSTGAQLRLRRSVVHLRDHLHEVPVHVIPCMLGRVDNLPLAAQAPFWGSIVPAAWSFMLAARSRGLGTVWTTFHLRHEAEAAALLGIPVAEVTQIALIPVAYTLGTDFRSGPRRSAEWVHWERW